MDPNKIKVLDECLPKVFKCVLLFAIAGMVASLIAIIPATGKIVDMCNVLIIAGITAFTLRLECIEGLADEADAAALKKVRLGVQIFVLGFVLNAIPVAGKILGMLAFAAAYVFMMLGFNALKKSETFPRKDGISLIALAMILGIAGSILTIIPVIGIIGKLLLFTTYLLILLGWKKVNSPAAPAETTAPAAE